MKKQLFAIASVAILAGVVTFSSCKKEDTTAPTITVTGGETQSQSLPATLNGGTWVNPTATATDDEDGDLSASITVTDNVDPNLAGSYTVTYTVSDAAGNTATTEVAVTIANDAANFNGNYQVYDTVAGPLYFQYAQTVTASTTINGRIHFNKFADYQNNTTIYASVASGIVSLPSQTTGAIGTNNHIHNFVGTGTSSGNNLIISYTDTDQTASATATGIMHLIHQ